MNISYTWLQQYVKELPEPSALADVFSYHLCEVESVTEKNGDTIFDLNILPNRAHDLLSHQGIAREVASQLGLSFSGAVQNIQMPDSNPTTLTIDIQNDGCRRYSARIIRNIKIEASPQWMREKLEVIGQRSINNIVDATNFVMFDSGQPTHAFDYAKLSQEKNAPRIVVRNAQSGESLTTLDGKAVTFTETDLVITDGMHPLAIAGVKGGTAAEVDAQTTDIVIEVANFDPVRVRKTARRLGIFTDSAKRFENDLSLTLVPTAMEKLSSLISKLCPDAVFEEIVDVYPAAQEAGTRTLTFSLARINALLGTTISAERAAEILTNYHFSFSKNAEAGDTYTIDVPPLRLDLITWQDMAEEFGRIVGYDAITPVLPKIPFTPLQNETYARICAARKKLVADGYREVMTYSFAKKGAIEVSYAATGKEFLRTSLTHGLTDAYELNRLNAPFLGEKEIKLFEIGTVFPSALSAEKTGAEELHVAWIDARGAHESTLDAYIPEISSESAMPLFAPAATQSTTPFVMWSLYPFIARDIAVWVTEGKESELAALVATFSAAHCVKPALCFDTFTKEGRTSLAYRFIFQANDRTLTDAEVNNAMETLHADIRANPAFEIR